MFDGFKAGIAAIGIAVITCAGGPASALTFNLIDTGGAGIGSQARAGFDAAADFWSSVLTNNVTVNLNIGFQTLGTGVLGSTTSTKSLLSMTQGYNALGASSSSTLDALAVTGLQPLSPSAISVANGPTGAVVAATNAINAANNGYVDNATRVDQDGSANNSTLAVSKANAKALGLNVDVNGNPISYGGTDGSIIFSDQFAFDFNPIDGIDPTAYDFIGVAIHEIGHALGFASGVDAYDARTSPNGPDPMGGLLENLVVMSTLDLFRYSAPGTLDWSTSATPKYFSIDGGASPLFGDAAFSLGRYNGDGNQASHWLEGPAGDPQLGILDPTSGFGQLQSVTALDLATFDAIGWNLNTDILNNPAYRITTAQVAIAASGVPETATWTMAIIGFGMIGVTLRRRRKPEVLPAL